MKLSVLLQIIVAPGLALASSQSLLIPESSTDTTTTSLGDFTVYQSHVSPNHSIRVKRQNSTLCDTKVDQYTGWLDVGHKHLFFWYFKSETEATEQSEDEPLALWYGYLVFLFPCHIVERMMRRTISQIPI